MSHPEHPGQLPPAGWYPDPGGQAGQRYWDGAQWTAHVAGWPQAPYVPAYAQAYAPGYAPAYAPGYAPAYAPGYAQPRVSAPAARLPPIWWGVPALAVLVVVGSVGTWITASFDGRELASVTGTDGGDGWFSMITAATTAVLMVLWAFAGRHRWVAIVAAAVAAIGAVVALIYVIDPGTGIEGLKGFADIGRGWGLWLAFVGSLGLVALSIVLAARRRGS
jgi:hypothetical protein